MVSESEISEGNDKIRSPHTFLLAHTVTYNHTQSSAELVSVIESVIDAGEELTKYFEAAIANSFSSIQAPVDTMEQQAEHCQVERMQGGEK